MLKFPMPADLDGLEYVSSIVPRLKSADDA
jgi:hypothetical protein